MSINQEILTLSANAMAAGRVAEGILFARCRSLIHSSEPANEVNAFIEASLRAGITPVMQVNNEIVSLSREAMLANKPMIALHIATWCEANAATSRVANLYSNANFGLTPKALVYLAAQAGMPHNLEWLIQAGVDIHGSVDGLSLLQWVIAANNYPSAIRRDLVKVIVSNGADLDEEVSANGPPDFVGMTALDILIKKAGDAIDEDENLKEIRDILKEHHQVEEPKVIN